MSRKQHLETLGLDASASEDDIKKAYRKLAQQNHPDKGGDTATFQKIKEAYEKLTSPEPEEQRQQRPYNSYRSYVSFGAYVQVSLKEAFEGCERKLRVGPQEVDVNIPAGIPSNASFDVETDITLNGRKVQLNVTVIIEDENFKIMSHTNWDGNLEASVEVDALDIMLGESIVVKDFLGKELMVKIPQGFDVRTRLKVAKYGYARWVDMKSAGRGDLYLRLVPRFMSTNKLDKEKVKRLNEAVNGNVSGS